MGDIKKKKKRRTKPKTIARGKMRPQTREALRTKKKTRKKNGGQAKAAANGKQTRVPPPLAPQQQKGPATIPTFPSPDSMEPTNGNEAQSWGKQQRVDKSRLKTVEGHKEEKEEKDKAKDNSKGKDEASDERG